ncbi:MAG: hypothetical protein JEZ14_14950 [Marinilabiliaceae bacterium]|nr:hypothetical protein [Marinilabiliaceae bacterium]
MKSKLILSVLFSAIVAVMGGSGIAMATGWDPAVVSSGLFAVSFIPMPAMGGMALAGVYREVWTGAVKEELSTAEKATFLDGIEDFSRHVTAVGDEMQVIHLVYMGVEPDVLINNTTYPIPEQVLDQEDIPIALDKYQTKVTPVTDDELYALSYDKISTVKRKHGKAIAKNKIKKAIHALAPSANTAAMPVIVTTGADDGTGRKRLVWADLVTLKAKLDALEVPAEGRRLVLCDDHENDLLLLDTKFKDQYFNAESGKPYSRLGFEFHSYVANPYYTPSTRAKLAFGAIPQAGDQKATVFFSLERAAKANGWTKMYFAEAKTNPSTQRNTLNFRHHFIVMPTREEARGAIVSDNV